MTRSNLLLLAAAGILLAQQAWAGGACLQHNRARHWRAVDESTILYTDVRNKEYTVSFRQKCRNVTRGNAVLVNRRWSGLSCLSRGDSFRVAVPGLAASTCIVDAVNASE